MKTEQRETIYNIKPEYLAKAQAHWARKTAQRKQPGNCGRCGKLNPSTTHKHCDKCRAYQQCRKAAMQIKPVVVDEAKLAKLERRIGQMEHNFAMMRLNERLIYKRAYETGKTAAAAARYFDAYPTISKQELSSINHAYASNL